MSDASDDHTLPASARRLHAARERGDVPRSSQLTTTAVLIAASTYGGYTGGELIEDSARWLQSNWLSVSARGDAIGQLVANVQSSCWAGIGLAGGLVLVSFSAALAAELLQNGLHVTAGRLVPDPQRLTSRTPQLWRGLAPLSLGGELLRWALPLAIFAGLILARWPSLTALMHTPPAEIPDVAGTLLTGLLTRLGTALLLLGVLHFVWSRWRWEQSLRMTPQQQLEEQAGDRRKPTRR